MPQRWVIAVCCLAACAGSALLVWLSLSARRGLMVEVPSFPHAFRVLEIGAPAPDFTLPDIASEGEVRLSTLRSERPVVLIFGSFSCNLFAQYAPFLETLYQTYKDRVEFLFINVSEASHPEPRLEKAFRSRSGKLRTLEGRREWARYAMAVLRLTIPGTIDTADGQAELAYGAYPFRLVVVGRDGTILADAGNGLPSGWDFEVIGDWMKENLPVPSPT